MKLMAIVLLSVFNLSQAFALEASSHGSRYSINEYRRASDPNSLPLSLSDAEISATVTGPFVLTYGTLDYYLYEVGPGKEIVHAVKSDAADFLVGEELTNSLVIVIEKIKEISPDFAQLADENIAELILLAR